MSVVVAADAVLDSLIVTRHAVPSVEVRSPGGRAGGRFLRLERHRNLVCVEARTGVVELRGDEEGAVRFLCEDPSPSLRRATADVLAVGVVVDPDDRHPLVVGYVFDAGHDGDFRSFICVDMSGSPRAYETELEAASYLVCEAAWRSGRAGADSGGLSPEVEASLSRLLASA